MDNRHIFDSAGVKLGWQTHEGQFYTCNGERIGYQQGDTYYTVTGEPIAQQQGEHFYSPEGDPLDWTSEADFYAAVRERSRRMELDLPI